MRAADLADFPWRLKGLAFVPWGDTTEGGVFLPLAYGDVDAVFLSLSATNHRCKWFLWGAAVSLDLTEDEGSLRMNYKTDLSSQVVSGPVG